MADYCDTVAGKQVRACEARYFAAVHSLVAFQDIEGCDLIREFLTRYKRIQAQDLQNALLELEQQYQAVDEILGTFGSGRLD